MTDQNLSGRIPLYRRIKRWQIILLIVIFATLVRLWAAWQLPIDADEPVYLKAGQAYAQMIKSGNLAGILQSDVNFEHPPLVKLMYSLPYVFVEPSFDRPVELTINRLISVAWGVLAVWVLALIDPLAGFFLATDSRVIKYTSEVYLESFPLFAGLMAIYAYRRLEHSPGKRRWFWISAALLGAAVAGKYPYGVFAIPILAMMWLGKRPSLKELGLYFLAALLAFFVLDPAIWLDPAGRLWHSLTFHVDYSTRGSDVLMANYPWYQPLGWISAMVSWHPQVFFIPTPDVLILGLAVLGAYWEWKRRPWAVVWAVGALLLLFAWPTHWPQYTLILIPALCLMAATGLRVSWKWLVEFADQWNLSEGVLPHPGRVFWIGMVILSLAIVLFKVGYEVQRAMARSGWSTVTQEVSPLPSNAIHAMTVASDGRVGIATDGGVAFWQPNPQSPWGEQPQALNQENSGLADDRVYALLEDRAGGWWIGTASGLSHWDGHQGWQTLKGRDLGLEIDQIQVVEPDQKGQIWVGTNAGAAVYDGQSWKALTTQNSGLADNAIFAIAEQVEGGRSYVWFGTLKGVSRLDQANGSWQSFDLSSYSLGWSGVADLLVDHQNRVWVATLGDGASLWDGKTWTTYRNSNSSIPLNSVTTIYESEEGVFWLGLSYSTEPGGLVARFDGSAWQTYSPGNSGYNGDEATAMILDQDQRLWIGTAINGLQIFQLSQSSH